MKFRNMNASFDARSMKLGDIYPYLRYNQIIDFYIFISSVKKRKRKRHKNERKFKSIWSYAWN